MQLKLAAVIHSFDGLNDVCKAFTVCRAKRMCSACVDISSRITYGWESGKTNGCSTCAAVLNADNVISLAFGNAETNGSRLCVEPRMGLWGKLAKGSRAALS